MNGAHAQEQIDVLKKEIVKLTKIIKSQDKRIKKLEEGPIRYAESSGLPVYRD